MKRQKRSRYLSVSYYSGRGSRIPAPYIRLKGRWLELAGFPIGTPIEVLILPERLVITHDVARVARVRDAEIQRLRQKLANLEQADEEIFLESEQESVRPSYEEVVCDTCSRLIESDLEEGGSFMGSYSVCPQCTERIVKLASEEEMATFKFIQGSFRTTVLLKRKEQQVQ